MRALMIVTSLVSYFLNEVVSKAMFGGKKDFNFEAPLTHLVWLTSAVSIAITFVASYFLLAKQPGLDASLWWVLSAIISCGTVAGALIPEFTKIFVSTTSKHVKEVTNCSKHGGASLNILSGFVAGNFSRVLDGVVHYDADVHQRICSPPNRLAVVALMPEKFLFAAPIFAFGLVAFGFLGMGPVTIAVDSYGPVTDNAQSVYELSQIEGRKASRRKSRRTSVSTRTSRTPSINWKRATARATPSRPQPNPCSSAPPSSARRRWCSASSCCSRTCLAA